MTNIQRIKFEAKFSVKYMNGEYAVSGFNHIETLIVGEDKIDAVLEAIPDMNEQEWYDFNLDSLEEA